MSSWEGAGLYGHAHRHRSAIRRTTENVARESAERLEQAIVEHAEHHTIRFLAVLLSNSQILQSAMHNYSSATQGTRYAVDAAVTIGYATPWRQVVALMGLAARRTPGIASSPLPFVRQTALSDSYVQYRLVAYAGQESAAERVDTLDRLHENILDVFNEYGVQIRSPNYEADPPEPQVVPRERWYEAPASSSNSREAKAAARIDGRS